MESVSKAARWSESFGNLFLVSYKFFYREFRRRIGLPGVGLLVVEA
jgi:hypothetical protein